MANKSYFLAKGFDNSKEWGIKECTFINKSYYEKNKSEKRTTSLYKKIDLDENTVETLIKYRIIDEYKHE